MWNGVKTYLDWLADQPRVGVYIGSNTSAPDSSATILPWDTEFEDTDSMHSTSINTSRVVATTSGRYQINLFVFMATGTLTGLDINPRVNAAGSPSGGASIRTFGFGSPGGAARQVTVTFDRYFDAGDYIEVFVTQTSGATKNIMGGSGVFQTGMQMRRVANS